MTEVRVVKFNLKRFLEEYLLSYEMSEVGEQVRLESSLKDFFNDSDNNIKQGVLNFFKKSELVKKHQCLQELTGNFTI